MQTYDGREILPEAAADHLYMVGCDRITDYLQNFKLGKPIKFPRPIPMTEEET